MSVSVDVAVTVSEPPLAGLYVAPDVVVVVIATSSTTGTLYSVGTIWPCAFTEVSSTTQTEGGTDSGCAWPQYFTSALTIWTWLAPTGLEKGGRSSPVAGFTVPWQGRS